MFQDSRLLKHEGMLSRGEKVSQELLNVIGTLPKHALEWANIIGKRFPEGEPAIAKNSRTAKEYYIKFGIKL